MADLYALASTPSSAMDLPDSESPTKGRKRRSRRLSKPRTNSSSYGPLKPRISLGDLDKLTRSAANSVADLLSPSTDKNGSRAVVGESAQQEDREPAPEETDERNNSVDNGNELSFKSGRVQRTGTRIAKRLSVYKHSAKAASDLALDQFEEPAEDYAWLKEKAQKDRQAMRNHRPSHGDEDAPTDPAPYRRKSLLTPGLATRGSDILRKPGAGLPHRRSKTDLEVQARYYNPHLSPESPLARIASLDVPGRNASSQSNRAATPAEQDYGRIGGALRIANGGAISPSLSFATMAESIPPAHGDRLTIPRWVPSQLNDSHRTAAAANRVTDLVQIVDADIYDPYATDAGNPWASAPDLTRDAITDAFVQATTVAEKPLPARPDSPDRQSQHDEDTGEAVTSLFDYFSYTPAEAKRKIEERESQRSSPVKEVPPTDGRRSVLQTTTKANEEEAMLFDDEPPIMQGPRLGPPTPQHRPSSGEATLLDSRLEMARILDNMMAASRYTPLSKQKDITTWSDGPSSSASEKPSPSWDDVRSSSHTSLTSIHKATSPRTSSSHNRDSFECSRDSPHSIPEEQPRENIYLKENVYRGGEVYRKEGRHHRENGYRNEDRYRNERRAVHAKPARPLTEQPKNINSVQLPKPAVFPVAVFTAEIKPSERPLPDLPPPESPSSPEKKKAKPMAKKLQKKPPRPKSVPVPVDRIVVSGQESSRDDSTIPAVPAEMRVRVAERWNSRPVEEREPTVPNVSVDYFAESQHSRNRSAPQFSPNAPPVPERSAARPPRNPSQAPEPPLKSPVADYRHEQRQQHQQYLRMAAENASRNAPMTSPGESSSAYSQSQHIPRPNFPTAPYGSSSQMAAENYTSTDEEDGPIDWAAARRAWAQRRADAGQGLRSRMERAREDIETHGSLFASARASWQAETSQTQGSINRPLSTADGPIHSKKVDNRRSLNIPLNSNSTPLSQPSAAPSPLKQVATTGLPSTPGSWAPRAEARHLKNSRSEPSSDSYFPASSRPVTSSGTGFEGDVDTDYEPSSPEKRRKDAVRNAGRYEGGFGFGFEPGKGVGGSAGTRGVGNQNASRKTGANNLAQGFGVDLSDVPIFVAKTGGR